MSRKRPLPGQKRNLLFYLNNHPSEKRQMDQLTVLINQKSRYVFPLCSWCIFHRWQEPKNSRGLLPSPNWSWCCPMQLFSVVGLNKTKRRDSLALDGTLSSIMTIKMANLEPCFKWEPPSDIIKTSKKATGQYNHAHRSYTRTLPSFWSASDTDYASFFVIHSSVLLLEKGVLFKHFICFWYTM